MKAKCLTYLLAAVLTGLASSCTEEFIESETDTLKNEYTKSWVQTFGVIHPDQNWNMATLVLADVDPTALGNAATVEVYSANPSRKGRLIGRTSEATTLYLDVVKGATSVYAMALDADGMVISAGDYEINRGYTAIKEPIKPNGKRRVAPLVGVEEGTDYFNWTVVCEDLGTIGDFDFNDIVFGIRHIAGENKVYITPLACGGIIAANVILDVETLSDAEKDLGEIHMLTQRGKPDLNIYNTWSWNGFGTEIERTVPNNWNMSQNMGGFKLHIEGRTSDIIPPESGEAPQIICIKGDWMWPTERTDIRDTYKGFGTWSRNPEDLTWLKDLNTNNAIVWKKIVAHLIEENYAQKMVQSQGWQWSEGWYHKSKIWDYVPGLVTNAILNYCEKFPEEKNISFSGTTTSDDSFSNNVEGTDYSGTPLSVAQNYADLAITDNGILKRNVEKKYFDSKGKEKTNYVNAFVTGSLDNIASGKVLLALYRISGANKYKNAADTIYHYLTGKTPYYGVVYPKITEYYNGIDPETKEPKVYGPLEGIGGFWHKESYTNEMWLDGLYMGAAFYAEYLGTFGNSMDANEVNAGWTEIYNQFRIIHEKTYNSTVGLNYHGWSAAPETNSSNHWSINPEYPGCNTAFWGRGMGWYFAALVDVLEYMPVGHAHRADLEDILQDVAAGILKWQDKDKDGHNGSYVWYQLLDENDSYKSAGNRYNYLESSASSMFTYAMLKGIRLGLLDEETYGMAADKAYNGLITQFISNNADGTIKIKRICQSAGLGMDSKGNERLGDNDYYLDGIDTRNVISNEGKAIGPFIFASTEYRLRHQEELNH